jgi:hypothetical protein
MTRERAQPPVVSPSLRLLGAASLALLLTTLHHPASANDRGNTPGVAISVHGVHHGGQIVYRYQVTNHSQSPIDAVTLGSTSTGKELPGLPWTSVDGLSDSPTPVPASTCKPFQGMTCSAALFQFDDMAAPKAVVQMEGTGSGAELILPGASSSVAEIYSPKGDPGYLAAGASVRFFGNFPKDAQGKAIIEADVPLTKLDRTAPVVGGTAKVRKDGGMLAVTVALQVFDNLDPSHAVVLEAVTANEALRPKDVVAAIHADTRTLQLRRSRGRVYYLKYKATDASENSGSVVIAVPGELP